MVRAAAVMDVAKSARSFTEETSLATYHHGTHCGARQPLGWLVEDEITGAGYLLAVTDHCDFGSLTIAFDERVLRPRTWTTAQSAWAAELLDDLPAGPVLELCSGAGQIGLLAVTRSQRRLVCVDADAAACEFTRANARAAGLADRVEVRHARLEEAVLAEERFPLIIADPPWVPRSGTGQYPEDPLMAIDGGDDGLAVARACLEVIRGHLACGGTAILQLGTVAQAESLTQQQVPDTSDLAAVDLRLHPRGVLVRIDRRRPGRR
jgi:methylase of polypeptide subunit release factors